MGINTGSVWRLTPKTRAAGTHLRMGSWANEKRSAGLWHHKHFFFFTKCIPKPPPLWKGILRVLPLCTVLHLITRRSQKHRRGTLKLSGPTCEAENRRGESGRVSPTSVARALQCLTHVRRGRPVGNSNTPPKLDFLQDGIYSFKWYLKKKKTLQEKTEYWKWPLSQKVGCFRIICIF